jgi:hypothetical protein
MEQLLSSQLTELRIKSSHRQLLCGRMGYGGEYSCYNKCHIIYVYLTQ